MTPEEAGSAFSQINALLGAELQRPMIVACDELQLLQSTVDHMATLGSTLTEVMAKTNEGRLIVVGITSRPEAVTPHLAQGFAHVIHLPLPDLTSAEDLLRGVGIPSASVVARELFNTTAALGMRPTFRGLCNAAHYWQTTAENSRYGRPVDIAGALATACNVVADHDYDEYLDRNDALYAKGQHFLDVWTKRYGTCFPAGISRRLPDG